MNPQNKWAAQLVGIWVALCLSIGTLVVIPACTAAQVATVIRTAHDALGVVAKILGFCEENGSPAEKVATVRKLYEDENWVGALGELTVMVQQLKEAGVQVPPEIDNDLVAGMAAAYSIEQGMRAISGRNPDGSEK